MSCILGIDLGIINLCMFVMEGGEFVVIFNVEGVCMILLVVVFMKIGECLVG